MVAAHSGFLLGLFNAALDVPEESTRLWFGTGEMRCLELTFGSPTNKRGRDVATDAGARGGDAGGDEGVEGDASQDGCRRQRHS